MKVKILITIGFLFPAFISVGQIHPEQMDALKVAEGSNRFAFDLLKELSGSENMVFSPYSISVALAMVQSGAEGKTAEEIAETMHFPETRELQNGSHELMSLFEEKNSEALKLFVSNALWAQKDFIFSEDYFSKIKKHFSSQPEYADFKTAEGREKATREINSWIAEKTENLITNMISPDVLNSLTRLVLANAVYFNGTWEKEFDARKTRDDVFYTGAENTATVKYMNVKSRYKYFQDERFSCIDIPYSEGGLSMLVLLPAENDIAAFTEELNYNAYSDLLTNMMYEEVEVILPKFKFEYFASLADILSEMGMPLAFSDNADFSGMTGTTDLKIDKVLHKAVIDVNEKGTEAAAATVVTMMEKSAGPGRNIIVFKADHPFVFVLHDYETGTILFMGKVTDPSKI